MRCSWLAGTCVSAGNVGQQLRWPRRHGSHGDGRDRGRQRGAVRWPVLPEPRGIPGKMPAGCHPGHRSAVRAVRLGPVRATAYPLLYHGDGVERRALLQRLWAVPRRRVGGAGCGKLCTPRRSGCMWYGFCRRCSGAVRGRRRSWCRYQLPCAVDRLWSVNHCSTSPPGCAASTRRCNPRRPRRFDVPAGGL